MKKLFFSAVALVAFSGVSLGNTVAVNGNIVEKSKKVDVKLVATDCSLVRLQYYNYLVSQGVPANEASGRSYSIYFQCMSKELSAN